MGEKVRCARYDNIRAFLMLCVVFQHLLEYSFLEGPLYQVNELFIMPAFVFLSGRLARFRPGALLRRLMLPYAAFQFLYAAFDWYRGGMGEWGFQLGTPYWLLWYLPCMFAWGMLLPALETKDPARMAAVLAGLLALGLAAGFDRSVGRYLSLSRMIVFLPFYAAGFYAGKLELRLSRSARLLALAGAAGGAALTGRLALEMGIPLEMYYHAASYQAAGGGPEIRAFLYFAGFVWIALVFLAVPDVRIPGVTGLGRRTMPVYLLHGFAVRLAEPLFSGPPEADLRLALSLALGLTALLGFDWRMFKKLGGIRITAAKADIRFPVSLKETE